MPIVNGKFVTSIRHERDETKEAVKPATTMTGVNDFYTFKERVAKVNRPTSEDGTDHRAGNHHSS